MDVNNDDMASGIATPVMLKFFHGMVHVAMEAVAVSMLITPYFKFFLVNASFPPIIRLPMGYSVKNAIEKYRCIRPYFSWNIPIPISDIASRVNMKAPILHISDLNLKFNPMVKISINIPAKINPMLKYVWDGSTAPRSLKAFLVHENHDAF